MTERDSILIVLGMHRSGTSFLTHCTEILGFALPEDRGAGAEDNVNGHFEPRAIVDLNDSILARDGALWARIGDVEPVAGTAEMAEALQTSFGDANRIVIKDPRMSLLLAGWLPWLESLGPTGALIALRHPAEVAASLARRDDIKPDLSYLSWIAHTLASLEGTAGLRRGLVLFPDWTGDVGQTLQRIATVADVGLPEGAADEVAARFDRGAVHGGRQLVASDPEIAALAHDLFDMLAPHARAGTMPDDDALPPYRRRFEALSDSARALEAFLSGHISRLKSERDSLFSQLGESLGTVADLSNTLQDTQAQMTYATRVHDEQIRHMTQLLEQERMTILKPIYRRIHRMGGNLLRGVLPQSAFDRIKRALPYPGGIPTYLAYASPQASKGEIRRFIDVPAADPEKPDVFVMSIINWDFRTQRPQHLATELARAGHRVFYIEMDSDAGDGSAREVAPNLHVLRLPSRGMRRVKPYSADVSPASIRAWVDHFYALADQVTVTPRAHVVVEHPYWWNFTRHLSSQYQITFDCMDEISGFSNTEQAILDLEEDMVDRADHMIVSSQYLYDKYSTRRPVALIRNGTDVSHFIRDDEDGRVPAFLAGKMREGAIKVGYVGAIAEWFDTELVEAVARNNPDFDIHLCGAVSAEGPARLAKLPNVTLHGEIAYADVPAFLMTMDVLIIPFRLLPIIKACDPVKFYEYSAVRKPTVSTALPELERAGALVTIAEDAPAFAQGIRAAAERSQDPVAGSALRAYALENAWSYRAANMLTEMERAPRVSVVVLAYGSADLTLECLHSLTGRGEVYPALDIIVVDNGSDANELERLREAAHADPRIRLIENGDNLGFARGNNVGIEAARGDYVLLLNNDTYVPPGAISAMVRHLQRNPEIGIVGPLTNNIGNEARIETSYADMAEMEAVARDLVTGYRGKWSEIPVSAYFCAMFRSEDLDRIGHLPTVYGRGMFEDDDHCASFRAKGLMTALAEDAFVHHHLSATFGALPSAEKQALFEKNRKIFEERWGAWVPHRYRTARPAPSLPDR